MRPLPLFLKTGSPQVQTTFFLILTRDRKRAGLGNKVLIDRDILARLLAIATLLDSTKG